MVYIYVHGMSYVYNGIEHVFLLQYSFQCLSWSVFINVKYIMYRLLNCCYRRCEINGQELVVTDI
jgi:hypothetical protein